MLLTHAGPYMEKLLRMVGDPNPQTAAAGGVLLAKALELPMQQGMLNGNIYGDLFRAAPAKPGVASEYPLDLIAPGTEGEHVAYVIPSNGNIPNRFVNGDYIQVSRYHVGNSIDFNREYAETCNWDIVSRVLEVLEAGFVRKFNTDAWRVVISAAMARGLLVYDDRVAPGYTSKRLFELGKQVFRRQGGGNSSSTNRFRMSRVYMSPEAAGDVRNWNVDEVDEVTRREIFLKPDMDAMSVFGVDVRTIDELGVGQEFQDYFANQGGTLPTYSLSGSQTKLEIAVGVDPNRPNAFVMPVERNVELFEDPTVHRQNRVSLYGRWKGGFACLEGRASILLGL